ncbi:MAG: sensory box histidine kinase [Myxococcales bacterium]|nr:sensory box histidine kinase [Myxococcales bacterium]
MTLRTKLLLAQVPLAMSLILVGAVSRRTIGALGENSQDILKDNYQSVLAAAHMRDAADTLGREALARALNPPTKVPPPAVAAAEKRNADFERELRFQENNVTETGEREATARVRAEWTRLQREIARVQAASPGVAAAGIYHEGVEPTLLTLHSATNEITTINQDAMVRKSERARRSAEKMSGIMAAVTVAAFLTGIFASVFLTDRLTRPLAVLAQAVRRVAQGDLVARARVEGRDEIAQVAHEFNVMTERLVEYRSSSLGELLQAQQSSQAAIDSLPDPVIVLNVDGGVLNVNRASETILGISAESSDPLAGAEPAVRAVIVKMQEHVLGGRGAYLPKGLEEATAVPTREGPRYFLPRANPVASEQGAVVGMTVLLQDVTRLRRFDELKTDMVATVAHEFRTPLTSLRMAIHLCADEAVGPLTNKQADLLFAARDDCERLQSIVDDLLDLSRIQAGRIELLRRSVSAAALIERTLDEHRAVARQADIELTMGAPSIDGVVEADPERVQLVFSNLVANAIRHTPAHGRIDVRAVPEPSAIRFEVRDSGAGIRPEHIPRLFERFYRVPGTAPGGAGLGLYICKEIVEAHGGRIGVESNPGAGAVFWFTLPAAAPLA